MAISKEDTARSYKGTVIGDNMVVSLNLKWLVQIITLCGILGEYSPSNRLPSLERFKNFSGLLSVLAINLAFSKPICLIPRAYINFSKEIFFFSSIAYLKLATDCFPQPSNDSIFL